ncbi:MAG: glycoside hydrolase family 43 protein [Pseudomonadota bacterium]
MAGTTIRNPILRGFNPDPSICRVGDDYYIAVSTFEWYPGVQIYQSRDLASWRLVSRPLNRKSLLDMRGAPDSCGVWAPCLSFFDGRFWLCYTDVRRFDGNFKDTHNYLTTCATIDGNWTDPVYLNSSGFDPSLFHDDDGRKWYVNMIWDHRPDRSFFHGIVLQEFSPDAQKLIGEPALIFRGTELDYTEAPHIYRHGDYYYLITAEGGTGYGHAVSMARSETIDGVYEADPAGPVLTARTHLDWPLQRNGHGDIVEAADGSFFLVHLCGRPLADTRRCPLGRETAIQRLRLTEEGWFRLSTGGHLPDEEIEGIDTATEHPGEQLQHDGFDLPELDGAYQWLRTPYPETLFSLTENPGHLRIYGRESPGSLYEQALVARRQTDFRFEATTATDFSPQSFQQLAGLICYYNSCKFHYLYISADDRIGRHIGVMSCEADRTLAVTYPIQNRRIRLPDSGKVWLRARVDNAELTFAWSLNGTDWAEVPVTLDQSLLSDEAGMAGAEQFTGAFVGMCCNDLTGARMAADFAFFSYLGKD